MRPMQALKIAKESRKILEPYKSDFAFHHYFQFCSEIEKWAPKLIIKPKKLYWNLVDLRTAEYAVGPLAYALKTQVIENNFKLF